MPRSSTPRCASTWRSSAGEQFPEFLAGGRTQAQRHVRARRLHHPAGRVAPISTASATCWPISRRPISSCRRPRTRARFSIAFTRRSNVQRLNDLRLAVIREMNESRGPGSPTSTRRDGRSRSWSATSWPCSFASTSASSCPTTTARCCRSMPTSGRAIRLTRSCCGAVRACLRHQDHVHPVAARQGFPLSGQVWRAQAEVGRGTAIAPSSPTCAGSTFPTATCCCSLERHARQHRQSRAGDAVDDELPVQERVFALPRQEARRVLRADPRATATTIGAEYRLPSIA